MLASHVESIYSASDSYSKKAASYIILQTSASWGSTMRFKFKKDDLGLKLKQIPLISNTAICSFEFQKEGTHQRSARSRVLRHLDEQPTGPIVQTEGGCKLAKGCGLSSVDKLLFMHSLTPGVSGGQSLPT